MSKKTAWIMAWLSANAFWFMLLQWDFPRIEMRAAAYQVVLNLVVFTVAYAVLKRDD